MFTGDYSVKLIDGRWRLGEKRGAGFFKIAIFSQLKDAMEYMKDGCIMNKCDGYYTLPNKSKTSQLIFNFREL